MVTIQLTGRITDEGKLEVELPAGLPAQEVSVSIDIAASEDELPWDERPWTAEEIAEMLKPGTPKTGAEIAAWLQSETTGWEDIEISGAEWVEQQREKSRKERGVEW